MPEAVKADKAKGSFLNHSEHKLNFDDLRKTVHKCRKLKMKTIVCVSDLKEAKNVKKLKPNCIAYEPKELIATGKSVTKLKPKIVEEFSKLFKGSNVVPLCGAAITNGNDVEKAKELGCKGVLVASAVTKAKNVEKVVKELI